MLSPLLTIPCLGFKISNDVHKLHYLITSLIYFSQVESINNDDDLGNLEIQETLVELMERAGCDLPLKVYIYIYICI